MSAGAPVRSDLHARLRRLAAAWLFCEERALLVAEEYALGAGRSADVLGLTDARRVVPDSVLARTAYPELTRAERRGPDRRNVEVPVAPEFRIIEVKASRADFLVGARKGQLSNEGTGLGARADYCYLLCPWGVAWPHEIPSGWGLLWWWEGRSERAFFCRDAHVAAPDVHARRRVRIAAGRLVDVQQLIPALTHPLVRSARSFHTLEGEVRHQLFRAAPARRLHPSMPLSQRAPMHRAAIIQSAFWRLYGR